MRLLTVLAATALIAAFALATMLPPLTSVADLVGMLDNRTLVALPGVIRAHVPDWAWRWAVLPVLLRPVWLLPAAVGVVLGGVVITLQSPGAPKSPRWKM